MYLIVSYTRTQNYAFWTGRRWSVDRKDAVRYAVRSRRFRDALGRALNSHRDGSVGLIWARG